VEVSEELLFREALHALQTDLFDARARSSNSVQGAVGTGTACADEGAEQPLAEAPHQ